MSNTTLKINRRVLHKTLNVFRHISDAKFELLLAGRDSDAEKLDGVLDDLENTINVMRGRLLDDWSAKVPNLLAELARMNTEVEEAVEDIKDAIQTAKEVVALIGRVASFIEFIRPLIL